MNRQIITTAAAFVLAAATAAAATPAALAAPAEDSLVCSKVKDRYAAAAYRAAFWPRSEAYGAMSWCDMKVQAVEHCVPVEVVLHETSAPYDGYRGPELTTEYTCYRIRCANGEGSLFLGLQVPLDDMFGARTGDKPRTTRICLPDR